ncbi:MAG: DUF3574 domain-containing protein [Burkholderiales bacterium]|nr:DUF3574 domain-containing protein [Phycisphaerae bacterium]
MKYALHQRSALVLLSLIVAGCAHHHIPAAQLQGRWQRTELNFGLGLKDGSELSEAQWSQFLASEITPRFPAGLSVVRMIGQWRDPAGAIVRENSHMVVIMHPGTAEDDAKIEAIRSAYVRQFEQDAVLRIDSPVIVRF